MTEQGVEQNWELTVGDSIWVSEGNINCNALSVAAPVIALYLFVENLVPR